MLGNWAGDGWWPGWPVAPQTPSESEQITTGSVSEAARHPLLWAAPTSPPRPHCASLAAGPGASCGPFCVVGTGLRTRLVWQHGHMCGAQLLHAPVDTCVWPSSQSHGHVCGSVHIPVDTCVYDSVHVPVDTYICVAQFILHDSMDMCVAQFTLLWTCVCLVHISVDTRVA